MNIINQVIWRYFITDTRYRSEKIGIYEGASLYPYGVYRATENSIMKYNTGGFNAPSRWAIYKRIMELAGEEYDFERFLVYDEINRIRMMNEASKSRSEQIESDGTNIWNAPPIVFDYPSTEIKK